MSERVWDAGIRWLRMGLVGDGKRWGWYACWIRNSESFCRRRSDGAGVWGGNDCWRVFWPCRIFGAMVLLLVESLSALPFSVQCQRSRFELCFASGPNSLYQPTPNANVPTLSCVSRLALLNHCVQFRSPEHSGPLIPSLDADPRCRTSYP